MLSGEDYLAMEVDLNKPFLTPLDADNTEASITIRDRSS